MDKGIVLATVAFILFAFASLVAGAIALSKRRWRWGFWFFALTAFFGCFLTFNFWYYGAHLSTELMALITKGR